MNFSYDHAEACTAVILAEDVAAERNVLEQLRATPGVEFINQHQETTGRQEQGQSAGDHVSDDGKRWAYYPWRKAVVRVAGPRAFNAARLDRNGHLITPSEQQRLQRQRVGVVGLSSGHAIAYCLAAQGLCGALRLADCDTLKLSNLNRVPATVFDLGANKATVAARRIAELDPYLSVDVFTSGVTPELVDRFLDGLDIVVDQADSFDILLREAAGDHRIPVIVATSDRGQLDVERYDLYPRQAIMHGLLGDIDTTGLHGLSARDKLPYLLRLLDAQRLSARGAASLVEVGETLGGWPQLASDIWVGAAAVAEAVRRIGLDEPLPSGRIQVDIADALDRISQPVTYDDAPARLRAPAQPQGATLRTPGSLKSLLTPRSAHQMGVTASRGASSWMTSRSKCCWQLRIHPRWTSTSAPARWRSAQPCSTCASRRRPTRCWVQSATTRTIRTRHFEGRWFGAMVMTPDL